jgi:hypothetical protein
MDNPKTGEYTFDAEGKSYILHYSNETLIGLEEDLDRGIIKILREIDSWKDPDNIRLGLVRAILWAGLHKHHPELTKQDASELIGKAGGVASVIKFIGEAFQRAFNSPGTKGTRPQRKSGTGTNSLLSSSVSDMTSPNSGASRPDN